MVREIVLCMCCVVDMASQSEMYLRHMQAAQAQGGGMQLPAGNSMQQSTGVGVQQGGPGGPPIQYMGAQGDPVAVGHLLGPPDMSGLMNGAPPGTSGRSSSLSSFSPFSFLQSLSSSLQFLASFLITKSPL